jgi:mutator protein MutT
MIHVVAAAVIAADGRVLIAERPPGKHLAGQWEFPGGKLEPGEAPAQGLERELREEIGVTIGPPRPLLRIHHTYPHGEVLLDVWVVRRYRGRPRGLDGQALRWCDRAALAAADLLPADRPILAALRLPERLRRGTTPDYRVVSAPDLEAARRRSGLVGAVCRSAAEAQAAAAAGADFLALDPVLAPCELAALCARVAVPLFARGVTLERAWALGATGINALGCF